MAPIGIAPRHIPTTLPPPVPPVPPPVPPTPSVPLALPPVPPVVLPPVPPVEPPIPPPWPPVPFTDAQSAGAGPDASVIVTIDDATPGAAVAVMDAALAGVEA